MEGRFCSPVQNTLASVLFCFPQFSATHISFNNMKIKFLPPFTKNIKTVFNSDCFSLDSASLKLLLTVILSILSYKHLTSLLPRTSQHSFCVMESLPILCSMLLIILPVARNEMLVGKVGRRVSGECNIWNSNSSDDFCLLSLRIRLYIT